MKCIQKLTIKKLTKLVFLPCFLFISLLLLLINSFVISVLDNNQGKQSYQYYFSTTATEIIQCNNNIPLKLDQLEIYSITGHKIFNLNVKQDTSCVNVVEPNNQFGLVHVIDETLDNNRYVTNVPTIILLALFISFVTTFAIWTIANSIHLMIKIRQSNRLLLFDIIMLTGFIVFFGMFSVGAGQDFSTDLQNYHLYNGWALLHNRLSIDVTPSNGFNAYLSSVLDAIQFYLIDTLSMRLHAFIVGSITGIAAFYSYKIYQLYFQDIKNSKNRHIYIICATLIGITGSANLMQVGTASNENIISTFIIIAIYYVARFYYTPKNILLLIAGLAMGIAIGFKLTAATFVLAISLTFAFQNLGKIKSISILILSTIAAYLATNGLWMFKMYQFFGNPFYPLFGNLINPATAAVLFLDTSFIPKDIIHWLFLPFLLFVKSTLTCESDLRDTRLGFVFLALIFILIHYLRNRDKSDRITFFIAFTFIINYIVWLGLFAIQRYTIPLEYLSGILIIVPFALMQEKPSRIFTNTNLILLTLIIVGTTEYSTLGRLPYKEKFYINKVKIVNSLVIFNENPITYLAPNWGETNVYINPPSYFLATSKYDYKRKDKIIKDTIIARRNIYIVTHNIDSNKDNDWLKEYHLYIQKDSCQRVNDISDINICKLRSNV